MFWSCSEMQAFLAQHRIGVSRAFFLITIALIIFTVSAWDPTSGFMVFIRTLGFVFLIVAALGRLWCSIYICGYKNQRVIQDGPYSIVRNPLYCFSLIGGVGIGFLSCSFLITALIVLFFVWIYPITISDEEAHLENMLGEDYLAYKAKTPRLMPAFSQFKNVEQYTINIKQMQNAFLDVVWFLLAAPILLGIDIAHRSGALPSILGLW